MTCPECRDTGIISRALADAFGAACIFGLLWAALIVTP